MIICLPNCDYQLTTYSWPVTSSIVGPVEEASRSGPLRAILPMEVVMVSMYVTPIASSLMMWLVLTVEIPGVTTSQMGMVPMGASRSTSTSFGIHKQAITPEKPHSRVGGCTSTSACTGEEGLGGVGVLGGEAGGFMGINQESQLDPTFSLKALDGWGISLAATTGQDGCSTFSHPINLGALSSRAGSSAQCNLGMSAVERVFGLFSFSFSGRATPQKTSSSVKERYHFTSSLSSYTLTTNNHGPPPVGRLFSSAQCWRALAYTNTFSLGISLISLHA